MSEIYYTLVSKKHHCPMWDIDLFITAKYRFFDNDNPYIAKYASCTCPIIENLKLPPHEQDKAYSLYRFCNKQTDCLHNIKFEPKIDTRKDNYLL